LLALISSLGIEWPVSRVRESFIKYFVEKQDHIFWVSSPVVPVNDPTLLFANAGMNQFKPLFLGTCDPTQEMASLTRAVNSQKCIRAGGKHNDLEDVGKDVYHHTFFEMLGNWSFGNYFKEEAIQWAWECLTQVFGLNPDRIYVTYFGGDERQNLPADIEARDLWLRLLPTERVLPFGCKENFWEMGAVGPCGPCSEIHYDRIGDRDAAHLVNADVPDVIEIWNIVFIQFNREPDSSLRNLPAKHVDTGMGLERLTSILQHKSSNYDTDIFMPIFGKISEITGCRPYGGKVGAEDVDLVDMAYRVIADHIRTLTFAITDGCVPANDGRGYVLRRILRRAVRYGQEILHAPAGFFTQLVPIVVEKFSDAFPSLIHSKDYTMGIIEEEESSFNRTLDQGVKHFKKVVNQLKSVNATVIPAKDTHILFTSMGFPLDLTQLMAAEIGYTVDIEGFEQLMESDRRISAEAEAARKGGGSRDFTMAAEQTSWLASHGVTPTESSLKYVWNHTPTATIRAIYEGKGSLGAGFLDTVKSSDRVFGLVLDQTSFYYESGGQIYDTGKLLLTVKGPADSSTSSPIEVNVVNCQVYGGFVVHVCEVVSDVDFALRVGDEVICAVDYERRGLIAPNHTMTHVLNYAIRKVLLGDSVSETVSAKGTCDQRGSLVDADKLRFDFSWNGSLSPEEIRAVETIVNQTIQESQPVYAQEVALSLAQGISSLRSVFGERYPDPVRVLSVGVDVNELVAQPDNVAWRGHSVEFCGGTHLTNTAQAEKFVLIEECGIAKGIRRITGLTRVGAHQATATAASLMSRIEELINMTPGAELNTATKLIKLEVDRATVSLVDKEQMRAGLGVVNEKLKNWLKASLAERTDSALAKIVEIAEVANANQQVRCRPSLTALLSHSSSDCHRRGNGLWWRGQSGEEDSRQAQDSPP
jgi:alanyl-tRNA synthetase